jgi:hypothetical protein
MRWSAEDEEATDRAGSFAGGWALGLDRSECWLSHRVGWGCDQARVPPLREPTRSLRSERGRKGVGSLRSG